MYKKLWMRYSMQFLSDSLYKTLLEKDNSPLHTMLPCRWEVLHQRPNIFLWRKVQAHYSHCQCTELQSRDSYILNQGTRENNDNSFIYIRNKVHFCLACDHQPNQHAKGPSIYTLRFVLTIVILTDVIHSIKFIFTKTP